MARRHDYDPLDYHDPTAGIAGAPPARSALGLRLVLAVFGLVVCAGGAVAFVLIDETAIGVGLAVLALVAAIDAGVVVRRRRWEQQAGQR